MRKIQRSDIHGKFIPTNFFLKSLVTLTLTKGQHGLQSAPAFFPVVIIAPNTIFSKKEYALSPPLFSEFICST
jgi:hypothetical protein